MLDVLGARFQQKKRTIAFPKVEPVLPDRFRGRPEIQRSLCPPDCRICAEACPTDAMQRHAEGLALDMGRCLFCGECAAVCPIKAIRHTTDYRLAVRNRNDLMLEGSELNEQQAAALKQFVEDIGGLENALAVIATLDGLENAA